MERKTALLSVESTYPSVQSATTSGFFFEVDKPERAGVLSTASVRVKKALIYLPINFSFMSVELN